MIKVLTSDNQYGKQIRYSFDSLMRIIGLECCYYSESHEALESSCCEDDVFIVYSSEVLDSVKDRLMGRPLIYINKSNVLFGDNYLKPRSIPYKVREVKADWFHKTKESIISICSEADILGISRDGNLSVIHSDIVSDTFFMLSRYEEQINTTGMIDQHGRFSLENSLAYKNEFLHRPVVNEYAKLLWLVIDSYNLGYKQRRWLGDYDFAACISHDVDLAYKYTGRLRRLPIDVLRECLRGNYLEALLHIMSTIKRHNKNTVDPYFAFDHIMDIVGRYGFKSTFFFMAGGKTKYDNHYNVDDERLVDQMRRIQSNGFEIGYHGSYMTSADSRLIFEELHKLESVTGSRVFGARQHFLRINIPETLSAFAKAGLKYDSTIAYAGSEGFRAGICHPYKPYDLKNNGIIDFWELPLIVMDESLKNRNYRAYSIEKAKSHMMDMIDTVRKYNGVFSILWHNSSFSDEWLEWLEVLRFTLTYLRESNAVGLTGINTIELFESYCEMTSDVSVGVER